MKSSDQNVKMITIVEQENDLEEEMRMLLREVVNFHKLYLTVELDYEKMTFEDLTARIADLKKELELMTAAENDSFDGIEKAVIEF